MVLLGQVSCDWLLFQNRRFKQYMGAAGYSLSLTSYRRKKIAGNSMFEEPEYSNFMIRNLGPFYHLHPVLYFITLYMSLDH